MLLATKFGLGSGPDDLGGSRRHIMRSVETSLRELGTDWIDLFQLHFPDAVTPIEETLDALSDLVHQGKVRYLGCSNFTGWMIADAHWTSETRRLESFVSAQNEWSLLNRKVEHEVVPACERFGFGVIPYFPLASGLLTGKVRRGEKPPEGSRLEADHFAHVLHDDNFDKLDRLEQWGKEHDRTLTEVALSWLASQPAVSSVIAGATSPEQVHDERGRDANGSHAGGDHGDRRTRRGLTPRDQSSAVTSDASAGGRSTRTIVPPPGVSSMSTVPPCSATTWRTIASPRPDPGIVRAPSAR